MKERMRELLTQGVSIYIGYVWFTENLREKKYKGKLEGKKEEEGK